MVACATRIFEQLRTSLAARAASLKAPVRPPSALCVCGSCPAMSPLLSSIGSSQWSCACVLQALPWLAGLPAWLRRPLQNGVPQALAAVYLLNNISYLVRGVQQSKELGGLGADWVEASSPLASSPILWVARLAQGCAGVACASLHTSSIALDWPWFSRTQALCHCTAHPVWGCRSRATWRATTRRPGEAP